MEKKKQKKTSAKKLDSIWRAALKENKCPYGCSVVTKPCEHLEAYLNEDTGNSRLVYTDDIERYSEGVTHAKTLDNDELHKLIVRLRNHGLDELRISILLERFINNKTFKEIAKEYNFVDAQTAHYFFKKAIKILKERGFRPEGEFNS